MPRGWVYSFFVLRSSLRARAPRLRTPRADVCRRELRQGGSDAHHSQPACPVLRVEAIGDPTYLG